MSAELQLFSFARGEIERALPFIHGVWARNAIRIAAKAAESAGLAHCQQLQDLINAVARMETNYLNMLSRDTERALAKEEALEAMDTLRAMIERTPQPVRNRNLGLA